MYQDGIITITVVPEKLLVHCTALSDYERLKSDLEFAKIHHLRRDEFQYVVIDRGFVEALRVIACCRECRIYSGREVKSCDPETKSTFTPRES